MLIMISANGYRYSYQSTLKDLDNLNLILVGPDQIRMEFNICPITKRIWIMLYLMNSDEDTALSAEISSVYSLLRKLL